MNRALFLDRDGTIIEDRGYIRDPQAVQLLPDAADALAELACEGRKIIIISNQSGVGRGIITPAQMKMVQARFLEMMRATGVPITASYFCFHAPDSGCLCRKPSGYLLERAGRQHSLDLAASWMIGDRDTDIVCGRNAGCSTIWLRNGAFSVNPDLPDWIADDWAAVKAILRKPIPETR